MRSQETTDPALGGLNTFDASRVVVESPRQRGRDDHDLIVRQRSLEVPRPTDKSGVQRCEDVLVWSPVPLPPNPSAIDEVAEILDPVLTPLGFAPGAGGASERDGQVIFCRGEVDSADGGCVDLVVDLEARPVWRITGVRYWGFPSASWHLDFESEADLPEQLANLARTLPITLA